METAAMQREVDKLFSIATSSEENRKRFVEAVVREHRTRQQAIISLMLRTIVEVSKCDTDGRNEAAVGKCKKIVEALGDDCYYLPYI